MQNLTEVIDSYKNGLISGSEEDPDLISGLSSHLDKNRLFIIDPEDLLYVARIIDNLKRPKNHAGSIIASEIMVRFIASIVPDEYYDKTYSALYALNSGNDEDEKLAIENFKQIGEENVSFLIEGTQNMMAIIRYAGDEKVRHYFNNALAPIKANIEWIKNEIKK